MSESATPDPRCTICASAGNSIFGRIGTYTLISCGSCTHKFVWPPLNDEQVARQYRNYVEGSEEAVSLESPTAAAIAVERAEIDLLFELKQRGNLLDVGSAVGTGLQRALRLGFKVSGVEPCARLTEEARRRWGLERVEIVEGTIADIDFPDRFFDVVVLRSVVEHLNEPIRDLRKIRQLLKDDGVLFVSTEDYDSPDARHLSTKFPYYMPPWHLNYFSRKSLRLALETAGLRDIRIIVPGLPWFLRPFSWGVVRSNPLVQLPASFVCNMGPIMKCWASPTELPRRANRLVANGFPRLVRAYLHRIRALFGSAS